MTQFMNIPFRALNNYLFSELKASVRALVSFLRSSLTSRISLSRSRTSDSSLSRRSSVSVKSRRRTSSSRPVTSLILDRVSPLFEDDILPERLFLGFLKEDLFYFFSKTIFSEIFAFAILLLCTLFDQVRYTIRWSPVTIRQSPVTIRRSPVTIQLGPRQHYLPKIALHASKGRRGSISHCCQDTNTESL